MGLLDWAQNNKMMAQGLLGSLPMLTAKTWDQYNAAQNRASQGLIGMSGVLDKESAKEVEEKKRKLFEDHINSGGDIDSFIAQYGAIDPDAALPLMAAQTKPQPKWSLGTVGTDEDQMQKIAYNTLDPTQIMNLGMPYKPTPQTQINMGAQKGNEALSKGDAQKVIEADTYAEKVGAIGPLFEAIEEDMTIFPTGKFANIELGAKQIGNVFGMSDPEEVAAGERLDKNMAKLVSQNMEFLKGAMSEGEREFTKKFSLDMRTSPEGNKQYIDFLKKVYARAKQKAPLMRKWFRTHNSSLDGFSDFWKDYIEKNPILETQTKPKGRVYNPATGDFE